MSKFVCSSGHKKRDKFIFVITLANIYRFS